MPDQIMYVVTGLAIIMIIFATFFKQERAGLIFSCMGVLISISLFTQILFDKSLMKYGQTFYALYVVLIFSLVWSSVKILNSEIKKMKLEKLEKELRKLEADNEN